MSNLLYDEGISSLQTTLGISVLFSNIVIIASVMDAIFLMIR